MSQLTTYAKQNPAIVIMTW